MPEPSRAAGRTALLLRSADRAAPTVAELTARGAFTLVCPLIDFELPRDTTALDAGLRRLLDGGFDWLVLTSTTTIRALERRAAVLGRALALPAGTRLAVVGDATAHAAEAAGLPVDVAPVREHSARGMLEEWPASWVPGPGSTVFMPQADIASDTLEDGLRRLRADPSVVVAYRTVDAPADPALCLTDPTAAPGQLDPTDLAATRGAPAGTGAVLFTSPSIVRRYLALVPDPAPGLLAIAIGHSTAAELRRNGWEPAATAATPSPAGLADAWEDALGTHAPASG